MKKILRCIIVLLVSIGICCGLSSCRLEESYKEFNINNITDNLNEDYFASDSFSFTTVNGVVIIPEIKAINHEEYRVRVSAYSKTGAERVMIKSVVLKDDDAILLDNALNLELQFEGSAETLYKGVCVGGILTEEALKVADGKNYYLLVEVATIQDDEHTTENITYEITVKGYKSFVWPT